MTLLELLNASAVEITVLDAMTGRIVLKDRHKLDRKTEKWGSLEVRNIHFRARVSNFGFSSSIRPYICVYASHDDIVRIRKQGEI